MKATLQHYGYATHYVDLTSDPEVACWFATSEYREQNCIYAGAGFRLFRDATYAPRTDVGYIVVLAFDNAADLSSDERLFDLSALPAEFVRPHRQHGWLLFDRPPTLPQPNDFWVATITVEASARPQIATEQLFPPPSVDLAFASLLSLPWVQTPYGYFDHSQGARGGRKEKTRPQDDRSYFSNRAFDVPEYSGDPKAELVDHKWGDVTIYEPHPIRMWRYWRFDLEQIHESLVGNIGETTKIIVTPTAKGVMDAATEAPAAWPKLGSDGLFFTFAEIDHDKVIEHGPPYHGIWLQRDDDLIAELPMVADQEKLTVCAGHIFLLRQGRLVLQKARNTCRCGAPEIHLQHATSALRLSHLLAEGRLILLPHPRLGAFCYVVITGDEREALGHEIERGRKLIDAILSQVKTTPPMPRENKRADDQRPKRSRASRKKG